MSALEDLQNLLKSPGWLMVLEHAKREWRDGYPEKVKMAIQRAKEEGSDLSAAVGAIDAGHDAVNALMSWPGEQIKRMEQTVAQEQTAKLYNPSRRGGL